MKKFFAEFKTFALRGNVIDKEAFLGIERKLLAHSKINRGIGLEHMIERRNKETVHVRKYALFRSIFRESNARVRKHVTAVACRFEIAHKLLHSLDGSHRFGPIRKQRIETVVPLGGKFLFPTSHCLLVGQRCVVKKHPVPRAVDRLIHKCMLFGIGKIRRNNVVGGKMKKNSSHIKDNVFDFLCHLPFHLSS